MAIPLPTVTIPCLLRHPAAWVGEAEGAATATTLEGVREEAPVRSLEEEIAGEAAGAAMATTISMFPFRWRVLRAGTTAAAAALLEAWEA